MSCHQTLPYSPSTRPSSRGKSGSIGEDKHPAKLGPSEHFVKAGYIFVNQDVRGRFASEGDFVQVAPHLPNKSKPTCGSRPPADIHRQHLFCEARRFPKGDTSILPVRRSSDEAEARRVADDESRIVSARGAPSAAIRACGAAIDDRVRRAHKPLAQKSGINSPPLRVKSASTIACGVLVERNLTVPSPIRNITPSPCGPEKPFGSPSVG